MNKYCFLFILFVLFQCTSPSNETNDNNGVEETALEETQASPEPSDTTEPPAVNAMKSEEEREVMKGYFVYAADAALFYPCGESKPIRIKGNAECTKLEKSYLRLENLDFAEKVYAELICDYNSDDSSEGKQEKQLVIKEIQSLQRGIRCE